MNAAVAAALSFACLMGAIVLGRVLRRMLPEHHLETEARKTIELALGLVATMAALLLGLLVSSAKDSFDKQHDQVIQMAAEVATLGRVLSLYGREAAPARREFHAAVDGAVARIWPKAEGQKSELAPDPSAGDAVYDAIQALSPTTEMQQTLKEEAARLTLDLARLRATLVAQSGMTISKPLLVVVVGWLVLILFGFSLLAPRSGSASVALAAAAASVAAAIFLLLELQRPFDGLMTISSEPLLLINAAGME